MNENIRNKSYPESGYIAETYIHNEDEEKQPLLADEGLWFLVRWGHSANSTLSYCVQCLSVSPLLG